MRDVVIGFGRLRASLIAGVIIYPMGILAAYTLDRLNSTESFEEPKVFRPLTRTPGMQSTNEDEK